MWDEATLDRPWPWLSAKITALLDTPPAWVLEPVEGGVRSAPRPATRIQQALWKDR